MENRDAMFPSYCFTTVAAVLMGVKSLLCSNLVSKLEHCLSPCCFPHSHDQNVV
uniref:Uncharacterized protein n=1 Tax=Arundo donax TaxID=35708 RepID=A0A0A8Z1M0_ARUDO